MSKLSFLSKVVVKDDVKVTTRTHDLHKPAEGADIRVRYNGQVFPSEEFAKKFNLEYQPKVIVPIKLEDGSDGTELEYGDNPGHGLDVFLSANYGGIQNTDTPFIMVAAVSRTEGKLDLFRGCEYDQATGKPKQSVLTQGTSSFGKDTLLEMLESAYGIKLDKETMPFVDLKVVGNGEKFDMPWVNSNGSPVYRIPKTTNRGDDKGKQTTVRRENIYLWAIVPMEWTLEAGEIVLSGPAYYTPAPVVASAPAAVQTEIFAPEADAQA